MKKVLKYLIPAQIKIFLWKALPKIYRVNTYLLKSPVFIDNLHQIPDKYIVRQVSWDDKEKLQKSHFFRGEDSFKLKVMPRLNSPEWIGLAVFDQTEGDIAYLAWVIIKSIRYIEEFGIRLNPGQFLLKDGYCVPEYRHQGLHTRMEQERINYCIRQGAKEVFIQIHDSNPKGKDSVIKNGYNLFKQNYVLQWQIFNIYREFFSFLRSPFIKVVK